MTNLYIGQKAKILLQNIYELAANNPYNFANGCLLSKLALQLEEDQIFTFKLLQYLKDSGLIESKIGYDAPGKTEQPADIKITCAGIDLAEN